MPALRQRTELEDMAELLEKIMDAKYSCYMPDDAMNHLRDAGNVVVDAIVETQTAVSEDRQAKLYAALTLQARNQDQCYTRQIARIRGSLELDVSVAA